MWVRFLPNEAGVHKLHRLWFGPCEVLQCLSETRFLISTPKGEQILPATRLKPYVSPFKGQPVPFHYFVDGDKVPQDDTYTVEAVKGCIWQGSGRNRKRKWKVKWRGHEEETWETQDKFVGHVNDVWVKYNRDHGINISVNDLIRTIQCVPLCLLL